MSSIKAESSAMSRPMIHWLGSLMKTVRAASIEYDVSAVLADVDKCDSINVLKKLQEVGLTERKLDKCDSINVLKKLQEVGLTERKLDKCDSINVLKKLQEVGLTERKLDKCDSINVLKKLQEVGLTERKLDKCDSINVLKKLQEKEGGREKLGLSTDHYMLMKGRAPELVALVAHGRGSRSSLDTAHIARSHHRRRSTDSPQYVTPGLECGGPAF
ncbi:protein phosphatase 1 regulatory subunit 7-like [Procambarus clarkii]|uniref:protein phosphatase 1 regulatory subunit 7-like n=1 Tax=Procambarus clarkii TaxID=6728 RepID=UPI003744751E